MAERVSWRRATINETELFQAAYSAFAVGVWRNLSARPPQDAGTVDFMCRLEEGKCKVFSWREAYAPSVHLPDGPPSQPVPDPDDLLTAERRAGGWKLLFDGKTSNGWITVGGDPALPSGWKVDSGDIVTVPRRRRLGIRAREEFTYVRPSFRVAGLNECELGSAVPVIRPRHVLELNGSPNSVSGQEYQITDDDGDPGARVDPRQRAARCTAWFEFPNRVRAPWVSGMRSTS